MGISVQAASRVVHNEIVFDRCDCREFSEFLTWSMVLKSSECRAKMEDHLEVSWLFLKPVLCNLQTRLGWQQLIRRNHHHFEISQAWSEEDQMFCNKICLLELSRQTSFNKQSLWTLTHPIQSNYQLAQHPADNLDLKPYVDYYSSNSE